MSDELLESYKEWKAATAEYWRALDAALNGDSTEKGKMNAVCADLKVKHARFVKAGQPRGYW